MSAVRRQSVELLRVSPCVWPRRYRTWLIRVTAAIHRPRVDIVGSHACLMMQVVGVVHQESERPPQRVTLLSERSVDLKLQGRRALVSGSTAGIGRAIAASLAREGASVIVNGRTQSAVDKAVTEMKVATGGNVVGFAGDLGTAASADELARRSPDLALFVNNLAIFEPKPFEEIPDADWVRFFEMNVLSGIRLARLFLPAMKRANWGRIIFISSESALQIPVEMIHYGMTKTAQIAVARGLAESVAGTGITVNSILPGPTKSRGVVEFVGALAKAGGKTTEEVEAEFFEKFRPTSLIKRFATPEEVASLVTYIASPLASATTGAAWRVDGGVVKSAF